MLAPNFFSLQSTTTQDAARVLCSNHQHSNTGLVRPLRASYYLGRELVQTLSAALSHTCNALSAHSCKSCYPLWQSWPLPLQHLVNISQDNSLLEIPHL